MQFQTTRSQVVSSTRCCVVFDPADGKIAHVHRVVTMEGAKETSEKEAEARTRHLARSLGLSVDKLEIIHVDAKTLAPGHRFSVDVKSRKLVGTPIRRP
jgi:hypothetical protein